MTSLKILFVEPCGALHNVFAQSMYMPLLGPVYLSTIARQAGFEVAILNENILGRNVTDAELAQADVLCLSCITATIERGKIIAKNYKGARAAKGKAARVIAGGIHVSMIPEDAAGYFDQVIIGEAENIIVDLLCGRLTSPVVHGSTFEDLDDLPIPDYSLIRGWKEKGSLPVMTSRGCPFDCTFCSVTKMFGRKYRAQSPGRVLREIAAALQSGHRHIFFVDDNFAVDIDRTHEILDGMIAMGANKHWSAQVRTDITRHPDLVEKMKKAGCKTLYAGFESVNSESLIDMKKKQTVEDIKRSVREFHRNGIMVHGMFILGNDPDTKAVFKATSDFCRDAGVDTVQYSVLTPLPGTDLYDRITKEQRLLHRQWSYYDGLHVVFAPNNMSAGELQNGMIECFSDFYSYANGINDALNAACTGATALVKMLYKKVHFPSLDPSLVKFAGKNIVKRWVRENREYLSYLRKSTPLSNHAASHPASRDKT